MQSVKYPITITTYMMVAAPPVGDPRTLFLARFVGVLCEDAMLWLASGAGADDLEEMAKRRGAGYEALLAGRGTHRMLESFDGWLADVVLAAAAVSPPEWLPMSGVIGEKVTLEVGARGLRSLFSSKPSEKDTQRVKRLGSLTVRILRAVFAADGALDAEEQSGVALVIKSFGLPEADAQAMLAEEPQAAETIDVFGEMDPTVAKALIRGAWLAAAQDGLVTAEEKIVRLIADKLGVAHEECESMGNAATARIEARKLAGQAAVDAVRFMLLDRTPGYGHSLALHAGHFFLPRTYRDEGLAGATSNAPVQLTKRHRDVSNEDKERVLGVAWAAAEWDDPSVARRAILRARHDRVAQDLGVDGAKVRDRLDAWLTATLAPAAFPMGGA